METWSEVQLQRLFGRYIRRLKNRKLFPEQIECLQAQYQAVMEKAHSMKVEASRIAFLPVFPRNLLESPLAAAAMMQNAMRKRIRMNGGYTFVMPELVTDLTEVPDVPYFLFNIDTGSDTLGMSPDELLKVFEEHGRRGLTDMEIVALGMHAYILSQANLYATQSFYDQGRGIDLRMEDGGHPVLCHNNRNLDWQRWSVPSCDAKDIIRCYPV